MRKHEFVSFYANLPLVQRDKPAIALTYKEVWEMLEITKEACKK